MGSDTHYRSTHVEILEDRRLMSASAFLHADRVVHPPTVSAVIATLHVKNHRMDAPHIVRRPKAGHGTLPVVPPVVSTPPAPVVPPVVSTPPAPVVPPVVSTPPAPVVPPVSSTPPAPVVPPVSSTPPAPVVPPVSTNPPAPVVPPVTSDPPAPVTPPTSTLTPPPLPGTWTTVFDDEFTGSTLASIWVPHQYWNTGATSGEGVEESVPSNVSVNGMLQLTAQQDNSYGTGYTGALVQAGGIEGETTSSPAAFLYGYAEARILIPPGQGLWPAFWLMPESSITTGVDHDNEGEIDVMEVLDGAPNVLYGTVHQNGAEAQSTYTSSVPLTAGWHTYAVNWEPGSITWYIDGTAYGTYTGPLVPSTPMYPIFDLAVGGNWGGMPNASTVFPATMDVNYIRIWQQATTPTT